MSFGSRLKEARTSKGLTQKELAQLISVANTAISNYENDSNFPNTDILYKIFHALGCDPNFLFQDVVTLKKETLTPGELTHIAKYRQLFDENRMLIDTMLDKMLELQKPKNAHHAKTMYHSIYYDIPVSAGTGEYLDSSTAVIADLEIEPPHGTDFILRVAGDSMEPDFSDGDHVYVKKANTLEFGDIGIFTYAGNVYIKKYSPDGLVSLNREYKIINAHEDIHCLGKVIGVVEGEIIIQ